jgi:hypothetical protein
MSAAASWLLVSLVVGLPTMIVWCVIRLASRASRLEEATPTYRHTCSQCGRVQVWREPFDQWSPCRACQVRESRALIVIDLDDFADADALGKFLDGADVASMEAIAPTM